MTPFRPSRDDPGNDPFLLWKVRLFVLGAGLGIWGMAAEIPLLVWVGMGFLAIGVLLRAASARQRTAGYEDDEDDEVDEVDDGEVESSGDDDAPDPTI